MKNQKLFQMIDKFAETANKLLINNEYQIQREKLAKFYEKFSSELNRIRNEMGGEIGTLRERNFDNQTFKLLNSVHANLVHLYKEIDPEKPYKAAEKLVKYVLDKPTASHIENLDFLAKEHLRKTNLDFGTGKTVGNPEMHSLDKLKKFAMELRSFMQNNPLITIPDLSALPPPNLIDIVRDIGGTESKPEQNALTNAGPNKKLNGFG